MGTRLVPWSYWSVFLLYLAYTGTETCVPTLQLFLLMASLAEHIFLFVHYFSLLETVLNGKLLRRGIFTSIFFFWTPCLSNLRSPVPTALLEVFIYQTKHVTVYFHNWQDCFTFISLLHCFHRHRILLKHHT